MGLDIVLWAKRTDDPGAEDQEVAYWHNAYWLVDWVVRHTGGDPMNEQVIVPRGLITALRDVCGEVFRDWTVELAERALPPVFDHDAHRDQCLYTFHAMSALLLGACSSVCDFYIDAC